MSVEILNRKAKFHFEFLNVVVAGMKLTGTEIKSIRSGNADLNDAYCLFMKDELYVKSLYIEEYNHGNINNHEPRRTRKLLLQKRELKKFHSKIKEKGFTIVPIRLFLNERGFAKLEIALAKGKKTFDKRHSIKQKDQKRDLDRSLRNKF